MNKNISILNFAQEVKSYIFNNNEKFIKWGPDNDIPKKILNLYDTVPEHESAINFIETNLSGDGLVGEEIDVWSLKKLDLDYLLFGGFTIKVIKLRNSTYKYEYIDISKGRFSPDKKKIGFCDEWNKSKVEVIWYDLITNVDQVKGESVYYFKNNKSREVYPRPHYLSAFKTIETADAIATYHNGNAKNGFTPSTIINFNNGEPDEEVKKDIERQVKEKFTGPDAQRFILSFNDTVDNAVTISKLDNDNLDQKFETLQKWIENQILVVHQITSGQLIGVKPENQGFSKTEYDEALTVFQEVVIKGFRNELEYALSTLMGIEIKIKDNNINDNGNNTINQSPNA